MKVQESANVPKRDTVVKTQWRQARKRGRPMASFVVGNAYAIAAQFVPQKPFQTKLDDVIATRR